MRLLAFPDGAAAYSAAMRSWLERAKDTRRPDDLFGVVAFDARRAAMLAPSARDAGDLDLSLAMREGTNIEDALRFANAMFPPGAARRLLLISDGVETAGDALSAARDLSSGPAATPVDVLPLAYAPQPEALVESLDAPPSAARDSIVPVRVTLRATAPARGTLRLFLEGRPVVDESGPATRRVEFGPGRTVETFQVRLADRRVNRFEAVFEPETGADGAPITDRVAANNRAEAFTISPGRGTVLLVDGVSEASPGGSGRTLARPLAQAGIDVETISSREIPSDLLSLQNYDPSRQNVAAEDVPTGVQQLLADSVTRAGSGFVMIGGPNSFGAAWKGSPIEPILPVTLDLPEQLIVPPAAIVIDRSTPRARWRCPCSAAAQPAGLSPTRRSPAILSSTSRTSSACSSSTTRTASSCRSAPTATRALGAARPVHRTRRGHEPLPRHRAAATRCCRSRPRSSTSSSSPTASRGSARFGIDTAERMRPGHHRSTIAVGDGADHHAPADRRPRRRVLPRHRP